MQESKRKPQKDFFSCPRALRCLRAACDCAKRALSSANQTLIEMGTLYEGIDFYVHVTPPCLPRGALLGPLPLDARAGLPQHQNRRGAFTRDRFCRRFNPHRSVKFVSYFFNGKEPNNPDEAVAYGDVVPVAIFTGDTSEKTHDLLLIDVAPLLLA